MCSAVGLGTESAVAVGSLPGPRSLGAGIDAQERHQDDRGGTKPRRTKLLFMVGNLRASHHGSALVGRGELVEHGIQDAVREHRDAILQPRPNDAGLVAFGAHCAASRVAGRASAAIAARSPRIA